MPFISLTPPQMRAKGAPPTLRSNVQMTPPERFQAVPSCSHQDSVAVVLAASCGPLGKSSGAGASMASPCKADTVLDTGPGAPKIPFIYMHKDQTTLPGCVTVTAHHMRSKPQVAKSQISSALWTEAYRTVVRNSYFSSEDVPMTTLRRFCCNDLFSFNAINLDPLTETVRLIQACCMSAATCESHAPRTWQKVWPR